MDQKLANLSAEALSMIGETEQRIMTQCNGEKIALVAYKAEH